jgi:hypothetical protein
MYPLVILGVIALVLFIFLQAINRNDMQNAGVSIIIGIILTYFIVFLRWSDKQKKESSKESKDEKEDSEFLFWLNSKY